MRVLGWMRRHGRLELLLELADGSKRLIPAEWTDRRGLGAGGSTDATDATDTGAAEGGAPVEVGTLGLVTDLLAVSGLVSALSARGTGAREQAARQSPCRKDSRAACAAQSAAGPGSGTTPDSAGPAPRTADRPSDHAAARMIAKSSVPAACHPHRRLPARAAPSLTTLLRQRSRKGLSPPLDSPAPRGARCGGASLSRLCATARAYQHTIDDLTRSAGLTAYRALTT
jgi:hypothetical protein